jgi:hypothetical protein
MPWHRCWREFFHVLPLACFLVGLCVSLPGCGGGDDVKSDSEGKARITHLFRLYKAYVEKNKKGPPNEQALRDFGAKLTAEERASYLIGDEIEGLFTSPRDNQKYVIRYNEKLEPTGPSRGVVWEAQGKDGRRYVALTLGYVEEYTDEMFKEYTK